MKNILIFVGYGKVGKAVFLEIKDFEKKIFDHKKESLDFFLKKEILKNRKIIAIDFSDGKSASKNIEIYQKNKIPFIMGSTNLEKKAKKILENNKKIPAVYCANMALPIIQIFKNFLELENFLNAKIFYTKESHQNWKKDISGTLKKVIEILKEKKFFFEIDLEKYEKIFQKKFLEKNFTFKKEEKNCVLEICRGKNPQVEKKFEDGYALHEFKISFENLKDAKNFYKNLKIKSIKKSNFYFEKKLKKNIVEFSFKILGRKIYCLGVLKSINFLEKNKKQKTFFLEEII